MPGDARSLVVLSDIHANARALKAALAQADTRTLRPARHLGRPPDLRSGRHGGARPRRGRGVRRSRRRDHRQPRSAVLRSRDQRLFLLPRVPSVAARVRRLDERAPGRRDTVIAVSLARRTGGRQLAVRARQPVRVRRLALPEVRRRLLRRLRAGCDARAFHGGVFGHVHRPQLACSHATGRGSSGSPPRSSRLRQPASRPAASWPSPARSGSPAGRVRLQVC